LYHKEPGRASFFVNKEPWKEVKKYNPNLILVHARGASKGMGEPNVNKNNHPFTSLNKSIALVHNGKVDDLEYRFLKQKYDVLSHCDSEILLRIFEAGECHSLDQIKDLSNEEFPHRLAGIRDIFSQINQGHMAVAVAERVENGDRILWLFRNQHRPLWLVDMRDLLGQIFFVSEPNIWEKAASECSEAKNIFKSEKLIEIPESEIWQFKLSSEIVSLKRYQIVKKSLKCVQFDAQKIEVEKKPCTFNVITKLDANDKFLHHNLNGNLPIDRVHEQCNEIINQVNNIRKFIIQNRFLNEVDLQQLISALEDKKREIEMLTEF
jgi:glucosamine 6-phosphate synthetase-like amidotransferase/phosphosugar isomerase protein